MMTADPTTQNDRSGVLNPGAGLNVSETSQCAVYHNGLLETGYYRQATDNICKEAPAMIQQI